MRQWDPSGELDWLCDFRKLGGFPITLAFVADSSGNKLIAAAAFRAPVLLRPGTALHIRYQARIFGRVSRDFAYRFARYAFGKAGSRYDALYCRPVAQQCPEDRPPHDPRRAAVAHRGTAGVAGTVRRGPDAEGRAGRGEAAEAWGAIGWRVLVPYIGTRRPR